MTKDDKILLLHFITRTAMYITTQDKTNVVSFITGYEMGSKNFDLSGSYRNFIENTFKIRSGSTGWPGQLEILSGKLSQNWLQTFKQTTLQFITNNDADDLKEELNKLLKTRIQDLIERINAKGDPWFNDSWTEEWQSLCAVDFSWFKQLWTSKELEVIQAVNEAVSSGKVFADKKKKLPTKELLGLKDQFNN